MISNDFVLRFSIYRKSSINFIIFYVLATVWFVFVPCNVTFAQTETAKKSTGKSTALRPQSSPKENNCMAYTTNKPDFGKNRVSVLTADAKFADIVVSDTAKVYDSTGKKVIFSEIKEGTALICFGDWDVTATEYIASEIIIGRTLGPDKLDKLVAMACRKISEENTGRKTGTDVNIGFRPLVAKPVESSSNKKSKTEAVPERKPAHVAVFDWDDYRIGGFTSLRGRIKNLTNKRLHGISLKITHFDSKGALLHE